MRYTNTMALLSRIRLFYLIIGLAAAAIQQVENHGLSAPIDAVDLTEGASIEKKITIIVADEETTTPKTSATAHKSDTGETNSNCKKEPKKETTFKIDATTKIIYIDRDSESGFLLGEIDSNKANVSNRIIDNGSRADLHGTIQNEPLLVKNGNSKDSGASTNFSVFLVSRHPEHIAMLLDVEEIDFEQSFNCENQEIRFSIIGEISKQLLEQKENGVDSIGDSINATSASESDESSSSDESLSSLQQEASASALPVSEAMVRLLNSPLNKTILDESDETNDFKIIESTIDYLHERTCADLIADLSTDSSPSNQTTVGGERKIDQVSAKKTRGRKSKRGPSRMSRRGRKRQQRRERTCPQDSDRFKNLMSERLREQFEWDEFKIFCGKMKQLVIPMRSLKISVYSDEFAPKSSFKFRYRFISDPTLLPALHNGKYYCRNRNVIDLSLKCNGIDDCGDASDESIKTCGYPSSRNGEPTSALVGSPPTRSAALPSNKTGAATTAFSHSASSSSSSSSKKRLTYVNGDVLHCCQSSEWLSLMPHSQTNPLSLQSLIGESMNLFSGPIFAPATKASERSAAAKRRVKRIVGGGVAQRGFFPGQASLQYELLEPMGHFCAGTLIHPQYVLTAGHCITKDGLSRGIKVVFGAHDLRQVSGDHIQVRYVDDSLIYPGVDVKQLSFEWENDMNNDIALLRLNAPVLVTPQVTPACLPPFNVPLAVNTTCKSIGWGQTHGSGNSNLLKHISLKVVDSSNCSNELAKEFEDQESEWRRNSTNYGKVNLPSFKMDATRRQSEMRRGKRVGDTESTTTSLEEYSDQSMICVKNDVGHGICQGDSGGPLYCDRVNSSGERCTEIYGVASFIVQYATVGAMCAVENLPEVFGEVSSKTEWISSTIKMFEQTYKLKYSSPEVA